MSQNNQQHKLAHQSSQCNVTQLPVLTLTTALLLSTAQTARPTTLTPDTTRLNTSPLLKDVSYTFDLMLVYFSGRPNFPINWHQCHRALQRGSKGLGHARCLLPTYPMWRQHKTSLLYDPTHRRIRGDLQGHSRFQQAFDWCVAPYPQRWKSGRPNDQRQQLWRVRARLETKVPNRWFILIKSTIISKEYNLFISFPSVSQNALIYA